MCVAIVAQWLLTPIYIGDQRLDSDRKILPLWNETLSVDDLRKLKRMDALEELYLDHSCFEDEALQPVGQIKTLKRLTLGDTTITNAALEHLKGLSDLEVLELDETAISDRGLVHLSGLPKLKHLNLRMTKISSAGLSSLRSLPLECLDLGFTDMNDDAVVALASMQQLRLLRIASLRNVSPEAIIRLRAALPQCQIAE